MKLLLSLIIIINLAFVSGDTTRVNHEKRNSLVNVSLSNEESFAFEIVEEKNCEYHCGEYSVYANYTNITKKTLLEKTNDKEKIVVFYDLDINRNDIKQTTKNKFEVNRNHVVMYYYLNDVKCINTYISDSNDLKVLKDDIKDYIEEKVVSIRKKKNELKSNSSKLDPNLSLFDVLYNGSFRKESKPYGYIDCDYAVLKYRANDVSSLYLVDAKINFTPGAIAVSGGNNKYESKWKNYQGYIKLVAKQAEVEVENGQITYGATPKFIDAYPVSNISVENKTNQEPILNTAKDPDDVKKYTWLYKYYSERSESFNLKYGYMFEMNNSGHDLFEGDLALRFDYKITVRNKVLFFNDDKSFSHYAYHSYY